MTPASLATPQPCASGCVRHGTHKPGCGAGDCDCRCHHNPAFPLPCDRDGGCRHTTAPDCRGCAPRPALPGGHVCQDCWTRVTRCIDGDDRTPSLLDLYDELLTPARVPGGARVSGSPDPGLALADGPRLSRDWIRRLLLDWRVTLAGPVEPSKAQRDAHAHAMKVWHAGGGPVVAPLPAGPYGRGLSYPATDDPHVTGPVVARHVEWLLSRGEYADQFVHDVTRAHGDAVRTVSPGVPDGVVIGRCPTITDGAPCGHPVRGRAGDLLIACGACGTSGDMSVWRRLLALSAPPVPDHDAPDGPGPVAHGALIAAWLSAEWQRPVTAVVIRQWASKGVAGRVLSRAGKDNRGRTLHPVREAEAIAAALYADREETPA